MKDPGILTPRIRFPRSSEGLRMELVAYRASPTWEELDGERTLTPVFENAANLIDGFIASMSEADTSGLYTANGLRGLVPARAEKLLAEAERLTREAARIRESLSLHGGTLFERLKIVSGDAARERNAMLQARLEAEDPAIREQFVLQAARSGNDALLTAALSRENPPFDVQGAAWRDLLSPNVLEEVRQIFSDRVSPQGIEGWHASILSSVADHLRGAAALEMA